MELDSVNTISGPLTEQLCADCGAPMLETNRSVEHNAVYHWYACSKSECNGSWLKKTATT